MGMNNKFLGTASNAHIVDLSHHNGIVDFSNLGRQGISMAINKACDGAFNPDERYFEHDKQTRAAGLVPGAYIFTHSYQDPLKQADKLCATMTPGTKFAMLDKEWDLKSQIDMWTGIHAVTGKKVLKPVLDSVQERVDFLNKMVVRIKANLGFYPVIYSSASFFDPTFGDCAGTEIVNCPLMVVDVNPKRVNPLLPLAWKKTGWIVRQCGIGTVGKEFPVDLDIYNGTAEQLRARFA
jgi:bacterioferritin (cytochrome b1)